MLDSMSRPSARADGSGTDAAILDAARELFETRGYHAVGLEAVAAKAGISRQAIYLHFESKAALLRALHERINDLDVVPVMSRVWDEPDARAGLAAFAAGTTATASKIVSIYTALDAASRTDPEVAASMRLGTQRRYADCMRMATWLATEGLLAASVTRRQTADVIWAIANIPAYLLLVTDRRWSQSRWTKWVTDTLETTLLEPTAAGSSPARAR
jgi:AcrR family transcriptional regulator